jgi:hypothetical protein
MATYKLSIVFDTDRPLSDSELEQLENTCVAQIEEPTDQNGADFAFDTVLRESGIKLFPH